MNVRATHQNFLNKIFRENRYQYFQAFLEMVRTFVSNKKQFLLIFPKNGYWHFLSIRGNLYFKTRKPFSFKLAQMYNPVSTYGYYTHFFDVSPGDTVIDAGACYGEFSIPVAKKAGRMGLVLAIEPEPKNIQVLNKNLKIRNIHNVRIIDKALWSSEKKLNLYVTKSAWSNTLYLERAFKKGVTKIIKIHTTTLDKILLKYNVSKIDFLKMDIEGSELEALKGARNALKITRKIVVELHGINDETNASHLIEVLNDNDFNVVYISKIYPDNYVYGWKKNTSS